jgi:CheY-like chemotaxis protein
MIDDPLLFLAGGLLCGLFVFALLRFIRSRTPRSTKAHTRPPAATPKSAVETAPKEDRAPAPLSDLHAQNLETAARLRDQREASRAAREAKRVAADAAREAKHAAAIEAAHREEERIAIEEKARQDALRAAAAHKAQQLAEAEETLRQGAIAAKPVTLKPPSETKVMIVDDSKVGRVKTNRLLLNHQFQSQMAEDGCDALEKIKANMPDIVITDVEMPNMDGFELTKQIRGNPATAHIPIIIISGNNDGYEDKAKEVGADLILGKPYSEENMIAQIHQFLRNGRSAFDA